MQAFNADNRPENSYLNTASNEKCRRLHYLWPYVLNHFRQLTINNRFSHYPAYLLQHANPPQCKVEMGYATNFPELVHHIGAVNSPAQFRYQAKVINMFTAQAIVQSSKTVSRIVSYDSSEPGLKAPEDNLICMGSQLSKRNGGNVAVV